MTRKSPPRKWLAEIRGTRTQAQIAKDLGISRQLYSLLELGIRNPSNLTAHRLAKKLDIPWTKFYEHYEDMIE